MASGNNSTSLDGLLKEYYEDELQNTLFEDNPFLGIVPKDEKIAGRHFDHAVHYGSGQSISNTFSVSQNSAGLTSELIAQFATPLKEVHGVAQVSAQLVRQSMNDRGAFMEAAILAIDSNLSELARDLGVQLYRNGSGSMGQIGSVSGGTVTMLVAGDVLNFSPGMELDCAVAEVTGSTKAYGTNSHGLYVISVDYDLGTFAVGVSPAPGAAGCNVTDTADGIPTAAANDFLYKRGTRNARIQGMSAWCPATAIASNDLFNGINRFTSPSFLGGSRTTATTGQDLSSVLEDAAAKVAQLGGKLTHFLMPHKQFASLSKSLGGRTQITQVMANAQVGYSGIKIIGSQGAITCLPDRNCPASTIMGIDRDSWKLVSAGKAVDIWQDLDGKVWLRKYNDAGAEVRFYGLGNLVCLKPRNNINITIAP